MDQPYCFCELAPLYGLGILSEPERQWVEQQVHDCPELAAELDDYQDAVTAIPYSTPIQLPSDHLKHRLFDRLGLEATAAVAETSHQTQPSFMEDALPAVHAVTSQELEWQPHPVPGVMIAPLHIDNHKREIVGLLRADPGTQYALHRHAGIEEIYMLTGDLIVGETVYHSGDYIRSETGSAHAPHTVGGCSFFFRACLDDEYLELINA